MAEKLTPRQVTAKAAFSAATDGMRRRGEIMQGKGQRNFKGSTTGDMYHGIAGIVATGSHNQDVLKKLLAALAEDVGRAAADKTTFRLDKGPGDYDITGDDSLRVTTIVEVHTLRRLGLAE